MNNTFLFSIALALSVILFIVEWKRVPKYAGVVVAAIALVTIVTGTLMGGLDSKVASVVAAVYIGSLGGALTRYAKEISSSAIIVLWLFTALGGGFILWRWALHDF